MSCCKRIEGACVHDEQEARRYNDLKIAQLKHDLKRPGISTWDEEDIEKKIALLSKPLKLCPNCCQPLGDEVHARSHDGAFGDYTYYTCNKN